MDADMQMDDDVVLGAVEVFRLLADETRVRILCLLLDAELTVGEMAERLDRRAPGVSQHLARLRRGRIVSTRRDGTHIHYRLADDHAAQMVIDALRHAEHGQSDVPRHHRVADGASTRARESVR
ncbi:ArsR/SmtB family transcription factor [Janibacter terrae]|uniref:ArsR/SmtB family transcription factor n=1 Tax=Janibacter terrae TaxID=103817 RepID=UPI0008378EF7|nr:metalloregulator ArsR/SmtB family transcription factor [Janibacter terrae]